MSKTVSQSLHVMNHVVKNIMLLHEDKKPMPNLNSPANSNNVNTVQTALQQNSINTDKNLEIPLVVNKIKNTSSENSHVFLRVLPVKISNGNKSVTVNAFDSGWDPFSPKCSKLFKFKW